MIDVLIVDDHPVMRELLAQVVQRYPDLSLIAEAGYGEEAVSQATRLQPAVALVDVHLPTMSGIETTRLIKLRSPLTVIIGLTASEPNDKRHGHAVCWSKRSDQQGGSVSSPLPLHPRRGEKSKSCYLIFQQVE